MYSESLDFLQAFELDFTHFFRRLSNIRAADLVDADARKAKASVFFHHEGLSAIGESEDGARDRIAKWLEVYRQRVVEDWGEDGDDERLAAMKKVNPNFIPRGWLLDEIIKKVQDERDFTTLELAMKMGEDPFRDEWGVDRELEEKWCGDVPKYGRGIMCSCSS